MITVNDVEVVSSCAACNKLLTEKDIRYQFNKVVICKDCYEKGEVKGDTNRKARATK